MSEQMRLVLYDGDTPVDVLPRPTSIQWGAPENDTPSLTFTYSAYQNVAGSEWMSQILSGQYDVAVQLNWGDGWEEPDNARFLVTDESDDTSDDMHIYTFVGIGVVEDTSGVVVTDSKVYDTQGQRAFTNATPGQILLTWQNYGANNGMLNYLTTDFTVDHTSDKQVPATWQQVITWAISRETTYRQVLDTLVSFGMINFKMTGNVLRVFNDGVTGPASDYDGIQRDLTDGPNPVELMMGRECIDGPQQISRRNLATDAWILGDNNASWLRTNSSASIKRGRRVTVVSQGGVTTEGAADVIGDKTLAASESQREQLTRTVKFDGSVKFLPYRDYHVGDWVYAPGKANGQLEKLRIVQVTLTQDGKGQLAGSIVLNDRMYQREVALQKQLSALSNGMSVGGGGSTTQPNLPGRPPAAPGSATSTTPGVTGKAYVDSSGHIRAVINVTWPGVTSGVDGQAINVDHYQVRVRRIS